MSNLSSEQSNDGDIEALNSGRSVKEGGELSSSSSVTDIEAGISAFSKFIDPNRILYDLKELKPILKEIYFCRREFIKYGYRANPNMTWCMCTKSIFMCHCESGSVWTHLLSAIYFSYHLCMIIHSFQDNKLNQYEANDKDLSQGVFSNPYVKFTTQESRVCQLIGCIALIFTMTSSTFYHLYSAISFKLTNVLLRIDLIGIGITIFTLCVVLVYVGFHAHHLARNNIMAVMITLFICQVIAQMMPCYSREENDNIRTGFYIVIIILCLSLAISWYAYYASEEEEKLFTFRLFTSFLYIFVGFWFYHSHYPEKAFKKSRFVQIFLQSHMFWHIFVTLNGYTLFWLLYDFQLYVEKQESLIHLQNISTQ